VPAITTTDGTRIAYTVWGDRGSPVVLIQGLGVSGRGWALQRGAFTRRHRCIVPDNRGTGHSDVPPGPYSLFQMASDVVAVLDDAGIDQAHVVGASMGGIIAQVIGVLHPERVLSLTLACTACRHHEWRREVLAEWAADVRAHGMHALTGDGLRWLVGPRLRKRFGLWLNVLARVLLSQDPAGFVAQVEAILEMSDELRFELHTIEAPTLVITGSQDALTPLGDAEELHELITSSELVVVPGAAHGVMAEAPNAFNRAVLDFLERVDAQRADLVA
jgi:3-oxoadipate enol-lactonase